MFVLGFVAAVLPVTVWLVAQERDEELSIASCKWKLEGYQVEYYGRAHYWNECTGELYYVDFTTAKKVTFRNE